MAALAAVLCSGSFGALSGQGIAQEAKANRAATATPSSIDPMGLYYGIGAGPDVASRLLLAKDGSFQFELMAGALDLWSRGKWHRADDGTIIINTQPRPKAPELQVQSMKRKSGAPISIHITTPNGRGMAGVNFAIGFDKGETIEDYTQSDGWQSKPSEKRQPRWIALREPIYDIILDQTPIPEGANDLRFTLIPNDVGVLDFNNTVGNFREEDGDIFLNISMNEGRMSFVLIKPNESEDTDSQP